MMLWLVETACVWGVCAWTGWLVDGFVRGDPKTALFGGGSLRWLPRLLKRVIAPVAVIATAFACQVVLLALALPDSRAWLGIFPSAEDVASVLAQPTALLWSFASLQAVGGLALGVIAARFRVIGLTGGIASGKSTVSRFLVEFKLAHVIDADAIARTVLEVDTWGYRRFVFYFRKLISKHPKLIDSNTRDINRALLRRLVFDDPKLRRKLSHVTTMPIALKLMKAMFTERILHWQDNVVLDAPLLFEFGLQTVCVQTVVVTTDVETQIQRVIERDGSTRSEAQSIIASQMPDEEKRKRATRIIDNRGTIRHFIETTNDTFHELFS